MYSHYLEITLKSNRKIYPDYFAGDLLQQLHHVNQRLPQKLAIGFPEIDEQNHRIGRVFRIFGAPEALEGFLNQPRVKPLVSNENSYWSLLKTVPESTAVYMSYVRDRRQEKKSPSAMRRAEERSILRAMAGKNRRLTCADDVKVLRDNMTANREAMVKQPAVSIPMRSSSTGQPFFILIRSVASNQTQEGTFNSYGLSGGEIIALPHF